MNVLLVGNGGREHAIAEAISRSKKNPELYAVMNYNNPGVAQLCKDCYIEKIFRSDYSDVLDFAAKNKIELAIIGPETPLSDGLADFLWDAGIPVVGPRKLAAQIEFDKAWARDLMKKYGIGGLPEYNVFRKGERGADECIEFLHEVAVKPKGLTGGKGVFVTGIDGDIEAAKIYAKEVLKNDGLVIEEKFVGEEFTVQAFVDGENLAFAPAVQDHKRAYDGDKGPNTGGMGAYTDSKNILPFMEESDYEAAKKIMIDTVRAIKKETGVPYKGILYGQFMATAEGIGVVEFNARFGDPEAMNLLPLLENDFLDVCTAIVGGWLDKINVSFKKQATVCKYVVPEGYPQNPRKNERIEIGAIGDAQLFYSGVHEKDGRLFATGSRAVAILGIGDTIDEAEKKAEAGVSAIKGRAHHRRDIGTPVLVNKRIAHMNSLRR